MMPSSRSCRCHRAARAAHAVLCLVVGAFLAHDAWAHEPLDLDRLYSLPWLIGTQPTQPAWSPDSRRLAFLWNDEGTNFYDVWVVEGAGSAAPVRVTRMPQESPPPATARDRESLQRQERVEVDRGVASVAWTADSRTLVFTFHGRLYIATPGGAPVAIAPEIGDIESVVVAPRANRAAVIADGSLWLVPLAAGDGTATRLVPGSHPGHYVEAVHWSPDGTRLAYIDADDSRVPVRGIPDYLGVEPRLTPVKRPFPGEPSEARRVGVIAAGGGPVTWMDLGPDPLDEVSTLAWSPSGHELLIDKNDLYIKDRHLLVLDPDTGRARVLVREQDPHNVTAEWWADWAPDGRGIYFVSDRDDDYHVYYASLRDGAVSRITRGPYAVFAASLATAANALYIVTNAEHAEERQVYRVDLAHKAMQRLTREAGYHEPLVSPDGRLLADLHSNDTTPPDLYVQSARAPTARRAITHSPLPEFGRHQWVAARYVTFPNVNDGTILHARMTLPPDFDTTRRYPVIIGSVYSNTAHNRWGGRVYHPTWALDQYLAQRGYVILNVDISGSSGYGKAFRQRIREDYGGVDVDDLYSATRYLIGAGIADPRRIGIWGSSYGGLLTATALFRYPGVFRAGVAGAPATSLYHAETGEMRTMMAPQDRPDAYRRASAFLKSDGLRDHLLIIHGMRDDTVLFKDSVTLVEDLILEGHAVDFVPLPNAPHGWDTMGMAQTRFAFHKLVDYFDRYLQPGTDSR